MTTLEFTNHAAMRMQQRSIGRSDLDLILQYGEDIDGQGILLDNKAVDEAISSLKSQISRCERLRNTKVVLAGGAVVTCCPCGQKEARRMKKRVRRS
jgi:trimethylamine:corrinoid methyltransferase-like protein